MRSEWCEDESNDMEKVERKKKFENREKLSWRNE